MPCGSPGRQLWPVGLFCSPWPEQALRANIHCQISLALNRIYTEWYPSKGYTFNITNSTSYDQYYVHGRTVFEVMVRITDDIFNTYLRKRGTVNPYYSEYCDGKSVTCPGLKQWGTVTLANNGRSALQILRYYYGSDIEIVRTSNIQSIPQSYPGSPLRQGDSGTAVFTLQRQLNRITKDYPFLGKLTVDGVFGSRMAATVRAFQKQFNLTADGVVGRQTWYKISYIYVSVKDLAELTSEGETSSGTLSDGTWGGTVLRTGSTGSAVEQLQFWLNTLAQYESAIPAVKVDGVYGSATANAVRAFQRKYGLSAQGVGRKGAERKLPPPHIEDARAHKATCAGYKDSFHRAVTSVNKEQFQHEDDGAAGHRHLEQAGSEPCRRNAHDQRHRTSCRTLGGVDDGREGHDRQSDVRDVV